MEVGGAVAVGAGGQQGKGGRAPRERAKLPDVNDRGKVTK